MRFAGLILLGEELSNTDRFRRNMTTES